MEGKIDKDKELKKLADAIRRIRLRTGLNQTKFAHHIDKDQPSINRLERYRMNPSYIYLLEVCKGLGITLTELIQEIEKSE